MGQLHTLEHFGSTGFGSCERHLVREATAVVIADERGQLQCCAYATLVERVRRKQPHQLVGAGTARDRVTHRCGKGKIEHRRQLVDARVLGQQRRVHFLRCHLAKDMKVRDAARCRMCADGRHERLPEFGVHMFGSVDAKTVNTEIIDPAVKNIDEALQHTWIFGSDVVQAAEVTQGRTLAFKSAVAAIVVITQLVEPLGNLAVRFARGDIGRVRVAVGTIRIVGTRTVGAQGARALAIANHIGGVIDDDVQIQLHAASVRGGHQHLQICGRAKVWIDGREVGDPVAVVAG